MNEVVTKRDFNVSVAWLYKAWTSPEHIKNWWGPDGFSNTFHEFEFNNGGRWRFTMHGPDGKAYENESAFETIKENELLVFNHLSKPEYKAEINFSVNESGRSSLVWKMILRPIKLTKH